MALGGQECLIYRILNEAFEICGPPPHGCRDMLCTTTSSTVPRVWWTMLEPREDERGIVEQSVLGCYEYRHLAGHFLHFPTASGRAFIDGSQKVPVWLLYAQVGGNTLCVKHGARERSWKQQILAQFGNVAFDAAFAQPCR
jgi:hypothetical protein